MLTNVKVILRNSFYLICSRILGIFCTLIFGVCAARKLGDAAYGQYSFITAFIAYFLIFSATEIQNIIVREVVQKKGSAPELLCATIVLRLTVSIISLLVIFILTAAINKIIILWPIFLAGASLIPLSIYESFEAVLRGYDKISQIALVNIIYFILKMLIGISIIFAGFGLTALFIGFFAAEAVRALLISLFYHFKLSNFIWKFNYYHLKHLVLESSVLLIKNFVGIIYYKIDILFLSLLATDANVGWYAAAINMVGIVTMTLAVASNVIFPHMAYFFNNAKESLRRIYKLLYKYIYIILLPFSLIVAALSSSIVRLVYGTQYLQSSSILAIGIFSIIPTAILTIQGIIILISGEYKRMMRLYLIVDTFKVVLCLFLIKLYGLMGAVIASLAVDTFAAIIYQPYAMRHLGKVDLMDVIRKPVISVFIILLLSFVIFKIFNINYNLLIFLTVVSYVIVIFKFKIITSNEIAYLRRILKPVSVAV